MNKIKVEFPKVTLIVTLFNSESFLETLLINISNINYPKKLLQIIFIDDYSSDDTKKIISNFKKKKLIVQKIFKKKNLGISHSRNLGLKLSTGDYITFLDADDLIHSNKIKRQVNFMVKGDYAASYTDYTEFQASNFSKIKKKITKELFLLKKDLDKYPRIAFPTLMIKREYSNLKFKPIETAEDFVYIFDLIKKITTLHKLPNSSNLYLRRLRHDSLSSNKLKQIKNFLKAHINYLNHRGIFILTYKICIGILFLVSNKINRLINND